MQVNLKKLKVVVLSRFFSMFEEELGCSDSKVIKAKSKTKMFRCHMNNVRTVLEVERGEPRTGLGVSGFLRRNFLAKTSLES